MGHDKKKPSHYYDLSLALHQLLSSFSDLVSTREISCVVKLKRLSPKLTQQRHGIMKHISILMSLYHPIVLSVLGHQTCL